MCVCVCVCVRVCACVCVCVCVRVRVEGGVVTLVPKSYSHRGLILRPRQGVGTSDIIIQEDVCVGGACPDPTRKEGSGHVRVGGRRSVFFLQAIPKKSSADHFQPPQLAGDPRLLPG